MEVLLVTANVFGETSAVPSQSDETEVGASCRVLVSLRKSGRLERPRARTVVVPVIASIALVAGYDRLTVKGGVSWSSTERSDLGANTTTR
jgi:hypothetical protein